MSGSRIAEQKRALRARMRERLAEVGAEASRSAGAAAAERLLALPAVREARGLLVFLSFGSEIDTAPLVERWAAVGGSLFVPRMRSRDAPMEVCRYPCALERSGLGIRQPRREVPPVPPAELARELDVAVVPGLAFDLAGGRLGRGGGVFDRWLAGQGERGLLAVGLGYDFQVVDRVPTEDHDVPLDALVTDARAVSIRTPSSFR